MTDSQSAADFDDWWPRALSRPPLLTALPQPRCLIQGGATTRAGERDSRRSPEICAAQMSSASSASRTSTAGLSWATFTKCQSCTLPFGQLRLHFTTRANSMKRADGKRVCRRSRESHAWSGRRTAAAHRWSLRCSSIGWRSSIATHSPSTASGVASAQRASNSRQKH